MGRVSLGQCLRYVAVMQLTEAEKIQSERRVVILRYLMR